MKVCMWRECEGEFVSGDRKCIYVESKGEGVYVERARERVCVFREWCMCKESVYVERESEGERVYEDRKGIYIYIYIYM